MARPPAGTERTFVALCKAGGSGRPRPAAVYHAVTPHCRMALCADEPGAGSRWTEPPAGAITCPACLRRLERLARGGVAVILLGAGTAPSI